jgi:hypothetical protein
MVFGSSSYNTKPTGSFYFPNASITFAFDVQVDYNDVVAKDITLGLAIQGVNVDTNVYDDYSTLANGSPVKGGGGVLVE